LPRVKGIVGEFKIKGLMQGLGIKQRAARLLIRIIREKKQIEKKAGQNYREKPGDNAKIAKKLKCSKEEVQDLWKAYQLFRRTQRRLGQKKQEP
jgi:hypothetical protein